MNVGLVAAVGVLIIAGAADAVSCGPAFAGQEAEARGADWRSYVVKVTEFRIADTLDPAISAADIVSSFGDLVEGGDLDLVTTMRLNAFEGRECMAHFGQRRRFVTNSATGPDGRLMQSFDSVDYGTTVRVTAEAIGEGEIALDLSYEAKRFEEGDRQAIAPLEFQCRTTVVVTPGAPTMAAGISKVISPRARRVGRRGGGEPAPPQGQEQEDKAPAIEEGPVPPGTYLMVMIEDARRAGTREELALREGPRFEMPEPMSDEEIAGLSRDEVLAALSRIAAARTAVRTNRDAPAEMMEELDRQYRAVMARMREIGPGDRNRR